MDAPHAAGGPDLAAPGKVALEVSPLPGRSGIRARGEISVLTRTSWEQALTQLARRHTGVSYVELSDVAFVDVAGVTALAVTAMNLLDGRVVVENPPPQLPRVLEMFWPGLDRIEVAL
ncbi:STAS domain-containing protein [Streptomyces sp. SAI-149]|uniref:STAS domain-containing protein n=1 Tax=unclassified Streptomyces TaxID=2593676 RepID=UPI002474CBFD|nr:STAS domain-containing protein [Streptomyces sp. SAI-149]MDH6502527.1 anti-anti-sigma factor [Streptomyces sp. SAI-149]